MHSPKGVFLKKVGVVRIVIIARSFCIIALFGTSPLSGAPAAIAGGGDDANPGNS